MGGQACVFYGAAQFSKDVDLALLAEEENFTRLRAALDELQAVRIAVPGFDPTLLARGHAVHFRCQQPGAAGLRVDVMTRLRDLPEFPTLWARRTTITEESGDTFDLMAVEDLVQAKKTQRSRDWPIIEALVEGHYHATGTEPTPERVRFWLTEARGPERLVEDWNSLKPRDSGLGCRLKIDQSLVTSTPTVHERGEMPAESYAKSNSFPRDLAGCGAPGCWFAPTRRRACAETVVNQYSPFRRSEISRRGNHRGAAPVPGRPGRHHGWPEWPLAHGLRH
jgi:hypothetical protein